MLRDAIVSEDQRAAGIRHAVLRAREVLWAVLTMTLGSLFTGIGGMDLGLERAGFQVRWQVEIDPFCRRVLTKHWPMVPKYADVKSVGRESLGYVDCIAGGFPCQDISNAGKRAGIEGTRSGLWAEYARIIEEIRPKIVIVENVSALRGRGLARVLYDLAARGYDAEWDCIPAAAVGAPHRRDRIFIVADADGWGCEGERRGRVFDGQREAPGDYANRCHRTMWSFEPDVGRVAHGVPDRVQRLKALGNAVVPQVAEFIGRRVIEVFS